MDAPTYSSYAQRESGHLQGPNWCGSRSQCQRSWLDTPGSDGLLQPESGCLKVLIDAGADPNAKDNDNWTPLHSAAKNNQNPAIVQVLIDVGADIEARTEFKSTPLHHAAEYNENSDILKVLIDAGADLNVQDTNNNTPLHHAANKKNPARIKILVDAGANVNAQGFGGDLPLDEVMRWGSSEEKRLLSAPARCWSEKKKRVRERKRLWLW